MALPDLLDPRMLSQVGETPPLQDDPIPVSFPPPLPVAPPTQPPTLPAGLGTAGVPLGPAPALTPPRPTGPAAPTFMQTLVKSIPMLLAGIAASKAGPAGVTGLLGGYTDAMERRRLLEEKQHEFDVQTAATEEQRQYLRQQYEDTKKLKIVDLVERATRAVETIDDPGAFARTVELFDDAGVKSLGLPPGFITSRLGGTFSNTKAMAKAQKDAQAQLDKLKAEWGPDEYQQLLQRNDSVQDATGRYVPIQTLRATAGLAAKNAEGQAVEMTPARPVPKTPFEQEQADVTAAVQRKQKEVGRPLDSAEVAAIRNEIRGAAAAAVRAAPTGTFTAMFEGQPTIMTHDATGTAVPVKDAAGKPVRAVPSQAIINTGAANDFAARTFSATRPDPVTANKVDPATNLTPNALYQGGMAWVLTNQMPALGQSNSGQMGRARDAIINTGSAIAAESGVDVPMLRAEYRAKAPALANLTTFYVRTAAAAGAAEDALQLAENQSLKVPRGQTPIVNTFKQWLATGDKALSSDPELAQLQLYIYTAGREYAKVTGGGAGSVAALTDYASKRVDDLLGAAQSPETFAKVAAGMRNDMKITTDNQSKQIAAVSQDIANFLGNVTGMGTPPPGPPPGAGGTGRQTGAGPAGGPPPAPTSKVAINGRVVTGPSGVSITYPTEEAAKSAYERLKAIK